MYEATGTRELYQPIKSCHVVCLGISNKSVTVPRQDSIHLALQHNTCTYTPFVCEYSICIMSAVTILLDVH